MDVGKKELSLFSTMLTKKSTFKVVTALLLLYFHPTKFFQRILSVSKKKKKVVLFPKKIRQLLFFFFVPFLLEKVIKISNINETKFSSFCLLHDRSKIASIFFLENQPRLNHPKLSSHRPQNTKKNISLFSLLENDTHGILKIYVRCSTKQFYRKNGTITFKQRY